MNRESRSPPNGSKPNSCRTLPLSHPADILDSIQNTINFVLRLAGTQYMSQLIGVTIIRYVVVSDGYHNYVW
jgi:hypothetical protein